MTKISSFFRDETWPTGLVTVLESSRARDQSCSWASFHEDKYFWSSFFGQRFIRMFRKEHQAARTSTRRDAALHTVLIAQPFSSNFIRAPCCQLIRHMDVASSPIWSILFQSTLRYQFILERASLAIDSRNKLSSVRTTLRPFKNIFHIHNMGKQKTLTMYYLVEREYCFTTMNIGKRLEDSVWAHTNAVRDDSNYRQQNAAHSLFNLDLSSRFRSILSMTFVFLVHACVSLLFS